MGNFRWITKPTKRYFFSYADKISQKWNNKVLDKYALKYINKLKKNNNEETITKLIDSSLFYTIPGLNIYLEELKQKLNKENGLAHGKVREYWLRRGPRNLMILIFTILITIGFSELLLDITPDEHYYSIIIGINIVLFNLYISYQRLTDSISSAMLRVGHDHYKKWKNENIYNDTSLTNKNIPINSLRITIL